VSIGVAGFNPKTMTSHGLIENVDKALYRAKDEGRNMVIVNNDSINNPKILNPNV